MVMLVNVFLPHLASTICFRQYSPGIVTGLLFNLPFSIYLFQHAMQEGFMSWQLAWILLAITPFATIALILTSLQIGKWFVK